MSATTMPAELERLERLPGVEVARGILREAFRLELFVLGPDGPAAHVRGAVMTGSSEVCRTALFTRAGFAACDAFYRKCASSADAQTTTCHLGLTAVIEPCRRDDGTVVAWVAASGFVAPEHAGAAALPATRIAELLRALDPSAIDPAGPVHALPVVRGDRIDVVRAIVRGAARVIAAHDRVSSVVGDDAALPGLWGIVGDSPRIRSVFELLQRASSSHANVLVRGESGTGKELVARALHDHGPRRGRPFVAQSCAAMADELLETTLFGHVRGAFSGAVRATSGLFGAADKGTLFLDEVGEMSPAMQVKLLRVLQEGSYTPVGGTEPHTVDVRVIAASHRDLDAMVARGELRQDLYYRLHVLTIELPPLRDRIGDLALLARALMRAAPSGERTITPPAWRCLERYPWPGNVRELGAEIERWEVAAHGEHEIRPEHLSEPIRRAGGYTTADDASRGAAPTATGTDGTLAAAVTALERTMIERGLERTRGNRAKLARELGISRTTLAEKLKRLGLDE